MSIQKEWLDFLREQYPVGSRIKLREMGSNDPPPIKPDSMGTLQCIDDMGTFHIAWDDGRGLGLVIGQDSFSVLPPEPTLLKFYMPLTANIGMIDEADDEWKEEGPVLDGEGLVEYKRVILKAVKESLTPMEAPRGIMCWYENKDSIAETVKSVFFSVEEREGQLWGVANCRVIGKLSPEELVTLTDYIAEEASCHWGDNFEQECIYTEDKELYVHFYNGDDWSIMTGEERFDPEFAHKLPDICWSVNQADGRLIYIKKGENGCFQSGRETGSAEKNRRIADDSNQRRGITSAQEQAMVAGSMFGWDSPGADPRCYEQHGLELGGM